MKKKDKNQDVIQEMNQGKPKKKRKKTLVIIAVIIVLLIFISSLFSGSSEPTALVTVATVEKGDLQESISTSGTIESEEKKVYFAPVGGTVEGVSVAAGDVVEAGDMLLTYKLSEIENLLTQASLQQKRSEASYKGAIDDNSENRTKLEQANSDLKILNQQVEDWTATVKRLQQELEDSQRGTNNALAGENYTLSKQANELQNEMAGMDATSSEYAEKAAKLKEINEKLTYNQYIQSVASGSDSMAKLQQEIARVQEELAGFEEHKARMENQKTTSESMIMDEYTRTQYEVDNQLAQMTYENAVTDYNAVAEGIRAEFDGIVTECSVVAGAPIMEGTQLLTLESSENVKITFSASKSDVEKLELGQKVDIKVSGRTYEGEISKINRMASAGQSGTPMVGAEVHIINPDEDLILGLDAKLYIYTQQATGVLMVPTAAINADKEGDFLYVVQNGVIMRKAVVCGISSDTYVEIKEGISEEEQVVLSAYTDVQEGMAVMVMPEMAEIQ